MWHVRANRYHIKLILFDNSVVISTMKGSNQACRVPLAEVNDDPTNRTGRGIADVVHEHILQGCKVVLLKYSAV